MTGLEMLGKYPLTANIVRKWFLDQMIESLKNDSIDEEFKNFMREQGIEDDKLGTLIDVNPRMLLDLLDENDVIVIIKYHDNFGFTWAVEEADEQNFYKTRKEAELFAIEAAFEILEEKLTPKQETYEDQ